MNYPRINRRSLYVKWARLFLHNHGIRYRFKWGGVMGGGWADPPRAFVQINMTEGGDNQGERRNVEIRRFLSSVFHEACHVFNARDGKYAFYHDGKPKTTTKDMKHLLKIALRAEVYTDERAAKLMKEYFPHIKFERGYDDLGKRMFRRYWEGPLREHLATRLRNKHGKRR